MSCNTSVSPADWQLVETCDEVLPLLEELRDELVDELGRRWVAVELLADELLRQRELDGSEVRRILTSLQ